MNHVTGSEHQPSPILDSRDPDPNPAAARTEQPAIEVTLDGTHAVEWLSGDIDLANAEHVLGSGTLAIAESRVDELVIDLSRVTFLDSTGLGALIHLRHHSDIAGKRVALRGITPAVAKIMTITGLAEAFGLNPAADAGRC